MDRRRKHRHRPCRKGSGAVRRRWGKGFLIFAGMILFLSLFRVYGVSEISMDYSLIEGDYVLVDNYSAGVHVPSWGFYIDHHLFPYEAGIHRGDLLAFRHPLDRRLYLKRCVALPGDTLFQADKHLYLQLETNSTRTETFAREHGLESVRRDDGVWLVDSYAHYYGVSHDRRVVGPPILLTYPRTTIPPHHYFMMGDLRDNSTDSRFFGPVPYDNIYYKVRWIIKKARSMDTLSRVNIF